MKSNYLRLNKDFFPKNNQLCLKIDKFCLKNGHFCLKIHLFVQKIRRGWHSATTPPPIKTPLHVKDTNICPKNLDVGMTFLHGFHLNMPLWVMHPLNFNKFSGNIEQSCSSYHRENGKIQTENYFTTTGPFQAV